MKIITRVMCFIIPAGFFVASCEGPAGPSGMNADETCIICHNREVVDDKRSEYEHSQHFRSETYEEGARPNCAPCHSQQGFLYAVENQLTVNPASAYVTDEATASLPGRLDCQTCHNKIHTTFTPEDFELTTTEAVPMLMWAGAKTLDFDQETSNLCVKCHQPRQVGSQTGTGGVINYAALVSSPTATFNMATIGYRTGVHYGTEGAMHGGEGGIEFGSGYDREHPHNTGASCATCHMAEPQGLSGGHSFIVSFKGCNVSGCHSSMDEESMSEVTDEFESRMAILASEINAIGAGHNLLQRDTADNQFHGYLDVFDRTANPTGYWGAPGNPAFPTLTNEQFGAIINFQLLVRDGSRGIHNPDYMMQLLENTIEAL